ncbi:hypothetical protein LTR86_009635 [Recurvomyces mirabilis]|nr:hypothetical protein LTR86_009635 [Recurvomyces mirabilis]
MVAQGGGGGPGGGYGGSSAYAAFTSNLAAQQSSAIAASVASVASVESAASAAQASSVAAATTSGSGDTISTSIPLGVSTTDNLAPSSTAAAVTPTSTPQSTSDASAISSAPSTQSTASAADATASSESSSQTTFTTSTKPAGAVSSGTTFSSASSQHGSASMASSSSGTAASETQNPLPLTGNAHHPHSMSHGALAAAVVVPILLALLAIILAFLCLRRRSKRNRERSPSGGAFLPAMREKFSSVRGTPYAAAPAPVVTSNRNNAYFTGLDTSSQGSRRGESGEYYAPPRRSEGGTTFDEPPPPYKAKSLPSTHGSGGGSLNRTSIPEVPEPAALAATSLIPTVREPHHQETTHSPFADPSPPSSPAHLNNNFLVSPVERPQTSRSISQRSFNSDQYSETASVHSVRVARLSVGGMLGGPHVVDANPFGDRHSVESPRFSHEEGEEFHSMIGSDRRRSIRREREVRVDTGVSGSLGRR